jgi:tetratricopeptide (TPR) repeat protein
MAIDYFHKVEKHCTPYVTNHQYYLYTLQCYEHIAKLYRHWDSRSIDYYEKMIRLCLKYQPNDLNNFISGYKGMLDTYKNQQLERSDHSEHIPALLCTDPHNFGELANEMPLTPPVDIDTPPLTPLSPLVSGILFQKIKHLDFAFEFYDKRIDPRLKMESDLRKKIIYCQMKLADLYYDQGQIIDVPISLNEAVLLSRQFGSELKEVKSICDENLSFMYKNYDFVIQSYKNRLTNNTNNCIDEDNYCYIALLYQKKNDSKSALEYLQRPIQIFEENNYICSHTIDCYLKLAEHYYTIEHNQQLSINTYERVMHLVKKHRPKPMIITILIIEEHLIHYFNKIDDLETVISIYKTLCEIAQYVTTDIFVLYRQFKRVLKLLVHKYDAFNIIINTYDIFLNFSLEIISPLSSQITMVLLHFRDHAIYTYKKLNQFVSAIEVYQKLLNLLFNYQTDTMKIISEYKGVAADFLSKHFVEDSIIAYENLLNFSCQHPIVARSIEGDVILFVFYVWKQQIIDQYLIKKNYDSAINLHYKMIHFVENYRTHINPEYNLTRFISQTLGNYNQIAFIYQWEKNSLDQIMKTYQEQIDFLSKYDTGTVLKCIQTIITKSQQFAADHGDHAIEIYLKLVVFLQKNHLTYLHDLSIAYNELSQLECVVSDRKQRCLSANNPLNSYRVEDLHQRVADYKEKATQYLNRNQFDKAMKVYRTELLPFLLENHARDDEQIAMCYKQLASFYDEKNLQEALNYYQKAIDIYKAQEHSFYIEKTFQLNPNVCRRYAGTLFMCYKSIMTIYIALNNENLTEIYKQKAENIYEKHQDQFQFRFNPITNETTIEIRPFVELAY